MPMRGWTCPGTRLKVPLDHFDSCTHGPHGRSAASPFLTTLAARNVAEDVRHSDLRLTVTGVLGCPRELYLDRTTDSWPDPNRRAVMDRGTALHGVAAVTLTPEIWSTEASDRVRHDLNGTIGEFTISALADAWRRDFTEIINFKFPLDWSVRFRSKEGVAKDDHRVQLNVERHLLAQQTWAVAEGYDPATVKLTVYDHGIGQMEGPLAQEAAHMTVEQILRHRPGGSALTFADHAGLLVQIRDEHKKLAPGDADGQARLAAAIPLVGRPMYNGKKCESYCSMKERCDELVRQFGEPA